MASARFTTSYKQTYTNPHGEDESYQERYLHKCLIRERFRAMRQAFEKLGNDGFCTREEVNILLSMYNLESAKSREISAGMTKKFKYTDFVRLLRQAKFKYLESIPHSIEKNLPSTVIQASRNQEDLIEVDGDKKSRFHNLNRALLAQDIEKSGLLRKDLLLFMLKLFGLDSGPIRYAFSRCDHNGNKLIAYVEFLNQFKNGATDGDNLGKTVGPCPRSPHRKKKTNF